MTAPAPDPAALAEQAHPARWRILPLVLSAHFLAQFDFFAVNVAAPSLQRDLGASDAMLELVVAGYAFTFAGGMVTGGRLGDLYGHRTLFLTGVATFALASVLCGVAPAASHLVAARLLQGLTAALMVPQVLAVITATFPARERPRALAWFGIVAGMSAVCGQVLGGLLIDADMLGLGWRALFLVNLPVGIVVWAVAARILPRARGRLRPRLDPVGAIGLSAALALALVPLALGRGEGWPPWTWWSLAAALPVLAVTVWWERDLARRGGQPLLDLVLFRSRAFSGGLVVNATFLAFWGSFMFVLALLLQSGLGLSAAEAGLAFLPLCVTFMLAAASGHALTRRFGGRVLPAGTAVTTVGLAVLVAELHLLGGSITPLWMVVPLAVIGVGNGLILPLLIGSVLAGVPPEQAGAASGVLTTTQQFASAAGVAGLGAVFFATADSRAGGVFTAAELVTGLDMVLVAVAGVLVLTLRPRRPVSTTPPVESPSMSVR